VVGNGDLAGADDLVDEDEVSPDAAGDRPDRDFVGAGEDPGRNPLDLQGPGLGQQGFHMAGDAVRPQAADDRGDAAGRDVLDSNLGGPGGRAALAAPAQDVDVAVDEAGDDERP
jgi:hypothetical protein